MIIEMFVTWTPLLNSTPRTNKANAKIITMCTQDRAIWVLFKMKGVPYPLEVVIHHVTWSASGAMTRCKRVMLCPDTRCYDLNGTFHPGERLHCITERTVCPVCFGNEPNLQITWNGQPLWTAAPLANLRYLVGQDWKLTSRMHCLLLRLLFRLHLLYLLFIILYIRCAIICGKY